MNLQHYWMKQLDAAELDLSWRSRLEAKVLRFLIGRYAGSDEETPVPPRLF